MAKLSTSYPILSLPIEVKNREFIGKLLLAAKAIEQGWAVVLGKQSKVCRAMFSCPPALHIEVSIPTAKYESRILPLVAAGHRLACLCEEGIVYPDGGDYCQRKVGTSPLSELSHYFANGQRQFDDITQFCSPPPGCLTITGNPRFDLLHSTLREVYAPKAAQIKARYGTTFVLINTNFSVVNPHPAYGDFISGMRKSGKIVTPAQELIWAEYVRSKLRLLQDYRRLIMLLHDKGIIVVIRPHPSEDQRAWKSYVSGMKDVHVIHDQSANAWMIAASAIIQSACTTGLEAFLLDKPLISYMPEGLIDGDSFISELGSQASTLEAVLEQLDLLLMQPPKGQSSVNRNLVRHHIANADQPFACDRIIAAISESPPRYHELNSIRHALLARRSSPLRLFASDLERRFLRKIPAALSLPMVFRRQWRHHLGTQKFSGLDLSELVHGVDQFRRLGVVKCEPCIEKLDTDLFLLSPSGHDFVSLA